MDDRLIQRDRDARSKVREAYYLRLEDFPGEGDEQQLAYDDYLEAFEDLVEDLMDDEAEGRRRALERLQALRVQWRPQVQRNHALYLTERRKREELVQQERSEQLRRETERLAISKAKEEEAQRLRRLAQEGIRAGTVSVEQARADLKAGVAAANAAAADAVAAGGAGSSTDALAPAAPAYQAAAPVRPPSEALVQPVDPSAAAREPEHMQLSYLAPQESYEADAGRLQAACAAGGYDREAWRKRYRQEAFSTAALMWSAG